MNIFLNETCKNAINFTDFLNSISLEVADLIESEAAESEVQEAVTELKEAVEKQEEAEEVVVEAVATEELSLIHI